MPPYPSLSGSAFKALLTLLRGQVKDRPCKYSSHEHLLFMRKRRRLAPWHRADLDPTLEDEPEAAVAEALAALQGKAAIYHCVSRVVNRDRVFKRAWMTSEQSRRLVMLYGFCVTTAWRFLPAESMMNATTAEGGPGFRGNV